MRLCRHVFAATLVFLATPLVADPARPATGVANDAKPQEPDTDIFALMSGKCSLQNRRPRFHVQDHRLLP